MKLLKIILLLIKGFPLAGKTLYDLKSRKFFHIKAIYLTGVEAGGFVGYYNDAHSNIYRQMLSYEFLSGCMLVGHIDKFPFSELDKGINAWKVKGYSIRDS